MSEFRNQYSNKETSSATKLLWTSKKERDVYSTSKVALIKAERSAIPWRCPEKKQNLILLSIALCPSKYAKVIVNRRYRAARVDICWSSCLKRVYHIQGITTGAVRLKANTNPERWTKFTISCTIFTSRWLQQTRVQVCNMYRLDLSHFELSNENFLNLKTSNYKSIIQEVDIHSSHSSQLKEKRKGKSLKIHSFSIHGQIFYLHLQRTLQTYSQKRRQIVIVTFLLLRDSSLLNLFFLLFVLGILLFLKL